MVKPVGGNSLAYSQRSKGKRPPTSTPANHLKPIITGEYPTKIRKILLGLSNNYSVTDTATMLQMSQEKFKTFFRACGISRWPYRCKRNAGAEKKIAGCASPDSQTGINFATRHGDAPHQHNGPDINYEDVISDTTDSSICDVFDYSFIYDSLPIDAYSTQQPQKPTVKGPDQQSPASNGQKDVDVDVFFADPPQVLGS